MNCKDWCLLRFKELSPEVRFKNGLNVFTKNRLDCTDFYSNGNVRGFDYFQNPKGMLFITKSNPINYVECDSRRIQDYSITKNGFNISSLIQDNPEKPCFSYGYPMKNKNWGKKKDKPNPLFNFRDDLFLFISDSSNNDLDVIIIPNKRNLAHQYYVKLWQGDLNQEIEFLRKNSQPFFNYSK